MWSTLMFAGLVVQTALKYHGERRKNEFWREDVNRTKLINRTTQNSIIDARRDRRNVEWPDQDGVFALVAVEWHTAWHEYLAMTPEVLAQVMHLRWLLMEHTSQHDPAQPLDFWLGRVLRCSRCARMSWRCLTSTHSHMWSWADADSAAAIVDTCRNMPADWVAALEAGALDEGMLLIKVPPETAALIALRE